MSRRTSRGSYSRRKPRFIGHSEIPDRTHVDVSFPESALLTEAQAVDRQVTAELNARLAKARVLNARPSLASVPPVNKRYVFRVVVYNEYSHQRIGAAVQAKNAEKKKQKTQQAQARGVDGKRKRSEATVAARTTAVKKARRDEESSSSSDEESEEEDDDNSSSEEEEQAEQNGSRQEPSSSESDSDSSSGEEDGGSLVTPFPVDPPSWTFRLTGQMLEKQTLVPTKQVVHLDDMFRSITVYVEPEQGAAGGASSSAAAASASLEEQHRGEAVFEWHKDTAPMPATGIEIHRLGSEPRTVVVVAVRDRPEAWMQSTSAELSSLLGLAEGPRHIFLARCYEYVEEVMRTRIKATVAGGARPQPNQVPLDAAMAFALGIDLSGVDVQGALDTVPDNRPVWWVSADEFHERILARLAREEPLVFQYRLNLTGDPDRNAVRYHIPVATLPNPSKIADDSHSSEQQFNNRVSAITRKMRQTAVRIRALKRKAAFYRALAEAPFQAVQATIAGHAKAESSRSSSRHSTRGRPSSNPDALQHAQFYHAGWMRDAVGRYLDDWEKEQS